ncbi:MAG: rod shape-determining protein RodA [Deltaproteobacteria bacterium]
MMRFRPQAVLIGALVLILFLGLVCLYSSCHQKGDFIRQDIFAKQMMWAALGLCGMALMSRFDYRRLNFFMAPLYLLTVVSLLVVLHAGRAIMGAQRWISFGGISFQPSELGKFVLVLVLARYYSSKTILGVHADAHAAGFLRGIVFPIGLTFLPTLLVMAQPDLGTSLVYLFVFFSCAFLARVRLTYLIGVAAAGVATMPVFWHFLKGYQKLRLLVFLNPSSDPLGAGYTVIQSKIAIGSGRLLGKGFMSGTQGQLNFLAERHTDFIFSVWAEEWGLLGSLALVFLYGVLIFAILRVAETAKDVYGRMLACGIAAVLFFHASINIMMNAGMCPVVGLPLPFFSYGGSSLVFNMLALGIVLSIARQK